MLAKRTGSEVRLITGQNADTDANLYDFMYREYGIQGRWPSPDPLGPGAFNLSDPQSLNRYAYVLDNPTGLVDPLGLVNLQPVLTTVYVYGGGGGFFDPFDPGGTLFDLLGTSGPSPLLPPGLGRFGGGSPDNPLSNLPLMQPPVSIYPTMPPCLDALGTARQTLASVNRADQNWGAISAAAKAHGVDPAVLAAIGVRETGFRDVLQGGGSRGFGIFQTDLRYHSGIPYTGLLSTDVGPQANVAAGILGNSYQSLVNQGFSSPEAELGAIRDYNANNLVTSAMLEAGYTSLVNMHTTHNNYVSSVLEIAASCF